MTGNDLFFVTDSEDPRIFVTKEGPRKTNARYKPATYNGMSLLLLSQSLKAYPSKCDYPYLSINYIFLIYVNLLQLKHLLIFVRFLRQSIYKVKST